MKMAASKARNAPSNEGEMKQRKTYSCCYSTVKYKSTTFGSPLCSMNMSTVLF
ncbi:hypothetical protein EJB05_30921 [Eragrostis curvula]|uniref:Uncharacterized protein n=1 Tax=Eragrostis curvula TaxID=38414 RepID=A0A5J9UCV4_9POAL|nr:hypothetical protein EJB05_30921 [Eragrostis curvula]